MRALPAGRHFFRGSDGYEAARRGTVWHRRVPDRYPEVIVQAVSADDIVSAIRYATVNGHKVSVVSGGHSFAASHLRDGAVLLDVSRIDHASIDADKGRAVVGPGKGGSVLMAELEAQGLFFPGGHCRGVCLGGYLLQGGYGWNSRIYGPACESVIGLDVITADGAQIHCDADNHADLYWAARGAGPGFFGRRHLVLPEAVSEAGHLWHQRLCLPIRPCRRGLYLGPRGQRRSRPSGRAASPCLPR